MAFEFAAALLILSFQPAPSDAPPPDAAEEQAEAATPEAEAATQEADAAAEAAAAAAADAAAVEAEEEPVEEMICRRRTVEGQNGFPVRTKVCKTKAQWAAHGRRR